MAGLRAAFGHVPASIFGTVVLIGTTQLLLRATDEAAGAVLSETPAALGRFVDGFGVTSTIVTGGLAAAVLMFVLLIGALLVWAELVVRSALVYLLVAFAPLALAAHTWPATRGVFRRLCELGVAIIVSKLVIPWRSPSVRPPSLAADRAVTAPTPPDVVECGGWKLRPRRGR